MNKRWQLILITTLVVGAAWVWMSRVPAGTDTTVRAPEPAIDHPAPDFTLATLDGGRFTLADEIGTPMVVNFWATWCGPCRSELPTLQTATELYAGQVLIVGVDQGEDPATVQSYVDELGLTFVIPLDSELEVGMRYNVLGLPTTYFIDADGVIRRIWTGEMNAITLAEGIAEIIP